MKSTKRILALFMAFAMVFCNMPSMAFAETKSIFVIFALFMNEAWYKNKII